ncbi:MAG: hypothetical protein ACTHN5_07005 [Phycisphaerae bacterium]
MLCFAEQFKDTGEGWRYDGGMEFAGNFETHLTVEATDAEGVARLEGVARGLGLKCTHIVLARGACASQPMVTRHGKGTLASELRVAAGLAEGLGAAGFRVMRVKVEVDVANEGVPVTKEEARGHVGRYFEHHVKLLLEAGADLGRLTEIARGCGGHVSRNALRARVDGGEERFVTQRCYGVTRAEAHRRLEALLAVMAGYRVMEVEEEFVVYDSDVGLDAGWMEEA